MGYSENSQIEGEQFFLRKGFFDEYADLTCDTVQKPKDDYSVWYTRLEGLEKANQHIFVYGYVKTTQPNFKNK